MTKKLLLSFSGVLLSATPVLSVVSCGTSNETFSETFEVSGIDTWGYDNGFESLISSETSEGFSFGDWEKLISLKIQRKLGILELPISEETKNQIIFEKYKSISWELEFLSDGAKKEDGKTEIKKGEKMKETFLLSLSKTFLPSKSYKFFKNFYIHRKDVVSIKVNISYTER